MIDVLVFLGLFVTAFVTAFVLTRYIIKSYFNPTCGRCGGKYHLGSLGEHYAKDCTPGTRIIWNGHR